MNRLLIRTSLVYELVLTPSKDHLMLKLYSGLEYLIPLSQVRLARQRRDALSQGTAYTLEFRQGVDGNGRLLKVTVMVNRVADRGLFADEEIIRAVAHPDVHRVQ
jgi:hypothetical protein